MTKNATSFQPGNTLSVGRGRPKLTAEQKAFRLATRGHLTEVITNYMALSVSQIEMVLQNKNLPVIDIAILKNLQKMHEEGSMDRADWVLDHALGKRAAKVEVNNTNAVDLKKLNDSQLEQLKEIALTQVGEKRIAHDDD